MQSKDTEFMQMALKQAQKAWELDEVPVGAALVCNGELLALGHNSKESQHRPTGHAEIMALEVGAQKLSRWRLIDCELYVTLEPCLMCAGAILSARLKRVIYGTTDPKAGAVDSLYQALTDSRLNHQVDITHGVLQTECSTLLKDFFKTKRVNS